MARERPAPPRPDLLRRPTRAFGWLDARLLHEGWLLRLGTDATAVLVLLALAADQHGASFYGHGRMSSLLGLSPTAVNDALERLLRLGLVAHRPWRPGHPDGVWQLLPLPARNRTTGQPQPIAEILGTLGLPSEA